HEEMPGERYALERQADAAADFHVKDCKRDRDAGLALDDLVQIAVARVVVVVGVAPEAEVVEEELVQRDDGLLDGGPLREAGTRAQRHALDLAEVALDVEARIGVLGDHQAGAREVDAVLFLAQDTLESLQRAHQAAPRREKSRRRKPKAKRTAPYAAAPST